MIPSPVNLSTVPPNCCTPAAQRSARSAMISRSRSTPTLAAISIEWTTSANSTVTCLYSADWVSGVSRAPHSPQNLAVGPDCAPQEPQSFWSAISVISRLFRGPECRSGLVDFVVCERHHGRGRHCNALAGERLVGLVAEDVAQ